MMDLKIQNSGDLRASNVNRIPEQRESKRPALVSQENRSFAETLRKAQNGLGVRLSRHAEERLNQWGQAAKEECIGELSDAMDIAQAKGARSTLVISQGAAFLVAPQSRTVITVVPEDRMKENLFTSIDSAVLMSK